MNPNLSLLYTMAAYLLLLQCPVFLKIEQLILSE